MLKSNKTIIVALDLTYFQYNSGGVSLHTCTKVYVSSLYGQLNLLLTAGGHCLQLLGRILSPQTSPGFEE